MGEVERTRQSSSSLLTFKRKRALEACDSCRKQKTRCLAGSVEDENRACLRCRSLNMDCSLADPNHFIRKVENDNMDAISANINSKLENRYEFICFILKTF